MIDSNNNTKYYANIDCIKGIGIILVVMGHHLLEMSVFRNWIYSFHMPLFFFITGYLWKDKSFNFNFELKKRISSLLYPYFTFSFLIIIWHMLYYTKFHSSLSVEGIWYVIATTLSTFGYHAAWFLPALFWASIIVLVVYRFCSKDHLPGIMLFIIGSIIATVANRFKMDETYIAWILIYIGRAVIGSSFIFFGKTYKNMEQTITGTTKKNILILIGTGFISIIGSRLFIKNQFMLVYLKLGNPIVYMFFSICGIVYLFTLVQLIYKIRRIKVLEYFGRNSIIVMLIHMDITGTIVWMIPYISRIGNGSLRVTSSVVVLLELILSVLIIEIINRYFAFLLKPPVRVKNTTISN